MEKRRWKLSSKTREFSFSIHYIFSFLFSGKDITGDRLHNAIKNRLIILLVTIGNVVIHYYQLESRSKVYTYNVNKSRQLHTGKITYGHKYTIIDKFYKNNNTQCGYKYSTNKNRSRYRSWTNVLNPIEAQIISAGIKVTDIVTTTQECLSFFIIYIKKWAKVTGLRQDDPGHDATRKTTGKEMCGKKNINWGSRPQKCII